MGGPVGRGFVFENEWYWRITENAQTFDAPAAARDFLCPLARVAKDVVAIGDIAVARDEVQCTVATVPIRIHVPPAVHDRVAVSQFINDLNHALAGTGHAFALVVPRRYELRGVLLTDDELAGLVGDRQLLIPSSRPSRAIPVA